MRTFLLATPTVEIFFPTVVQVCGSIGCVCSGICRQYEQLLLHHELTMFADSYRPAC